ncbi:hypothetical protein ACFU99_00740 [Streptomyces sp. NPDC057654]|uniref:hypothetical protein n=1 Tax=Streptomyces sp. NPDC057654 TaxID=3346196 RepID=UPI0036AFA01C
MDNKITQTTAHGVVLQGRDISQLHFGDSTRTYEIDGKIWDRRFEVISEFTQKWRAFRASMVSYHNVTLDQELAVSPDGQIWDAISQIDDMIVRMRVLGMRTEGPLADIAQMARALAGFLETQGRPMLPCPIGHNGENTRRQFLTFIDFDFQRFCNAAQEDLSTKQAD